MIINCPPNPNRRVERGPGNDAAELEKLSSRAEIEAALSRMPRSYAAQVRSCLEIERRRRLAERKHRSLTW